ncbi:hypothetical protein [Bacteroides sp. 519]|uniref:hypothetical protein n=1 Tax=Bacteroides sp. 519 TaxID=2302937 RepID=UPI0013D01C29|nr:hypothetical protein [Bacteroides sp. 519]NDV60432.1 hypothetical protein [Bacteroides sp. 519]
MKKVLFLVICFICISATASAIPILYSNGLKFETKEQLPDSVIINNGHVNFGVSFKQFSIFWVPLWNYGETEYVLVTDDEKNAYELDTDELAYIKETYNIDTDKAPEISFWNKMGGKLIVIVLILFLIWGSRSKKEENNEVPPSASPEQ